MRSRSKIRLVVAGLVTALFLGIVYFRYWKVYYGFEPLPFTESGWAAATRDERGYMSHDLVSSGRLNALAEEDVVKLLGVPDFRSAGTLDYEVGYLGFNRRAPMVFSYSLSITLSESGKVSDTIIHD